MHGLRGGSLGIIRRIVLQDQLCFSSLLNRVFADEIYGEVLPVNPVHVISKDEPEGDADRNRERCYNPI